MVSAAVDKPDQDVRKTRLQAILRGFLSGAGSRVVSALVSFISVPLAIGYLGRERYGVWIVITSFLAWLGLADLGIANGLSNAIAAATTSDRARLIRTYISTAFAGVLCSISAVGIIIAVVWPHLDFGSLLGVSSDLAKTEVGPAIAVALLVFLLAFPLSLTNRVLISIQQGQIANYWTMAGAVLSLCALVVATHFRGGLVLLVLAIAGSTLLVSAASTLWLFAKFRPEFSPRLGSITKDAARKVFGVGSAFFLIQAMALVVYESDTLIIAHFLGARHVASYGLAYKVFGYVGLPQTLLFPYIWVAYTEAIARKDIGWVRRAFLLNIAGNVLVTSVLSLVLIVAAQPIIALWGGRDVVPSRDLIYWLAAWSVIGGLANVIAVLLAAASHLKAQMIYSAASTVVNLTLSILLVRTWGATGVIAATVIAYLICICVPASIDSSLLLKKLRRNAV